MNTHIIGVKGENLAISYLKKQRYKILERNFTCHFGEIDIVAQDGELVVFIEVKSRSTDKFGLPREAVTARKQRTITSCATYWLSRNSLVGSPVRFDVVEILGSEVTLLKDAFRP